jgi:hypothetical protein
MLRKMRTMHSLQGEGLVPPFPCRELGAPTEWGLGSGG